MTTRVIIFGAEGMLGSALLAAVDAVPDLAATGLDWDACDITDLERIQEVCSILRPQVLVNCAGWTDVDGAEAHEEDVMEVNATGAGNVAKVARGHGARMIQISTDYVFDGKAQTPYRETARPNPLSVYGRSKLAGEEAVREATRKHLIVRTAWLYGDGGRSFVSTILEKARAGPGPQVLEVVDDQVGSPTYTCDLAQVLVECIREGRSGTVHAVNEGATSWYGLAARVLEYAGVGADLRPITTAERPRPAPRPGYSVLDCTKLGKWLDGGMAPWEDALRRFVAPETYVEPEL
jgi:dTDP-4-dehydrorhamnose reductase